MSTALVLTMPFGKHAYPNILNILPPKTESFQIKNSDIFHISAQNIDCEYSLEPLTAVLYHYKIRLFKYIDNFTSEN